METAERRFEAPTAESKLHVPPPETAPLIDSVALARLIEEVRIEPEPLAMGRHYNRTHNRHNR